MGYALFAQRKLVLDSQLNSTQLQQTQRSNEQFQLATRTMSLQQQLSALHENQAMLLQAEYEKLANVSVDKKQYEDTEGKVSEDYYKALSAARQDVQDDILVLQEGFKAEEEFINRQIAQVELKENIIEMEVKRLETQVSALQQQLEKVEEAEGDSIKRATPSFKGAA